MTSHHARDAREGRSDDRAATIIDLEERSPSDPHRPPAAALHSSQGSYAIDVSSDEHQSKRRKIERACDFCRRRKTKCDGPKMLDNVCTNCLQTGRQCTYIESSKPRGPPKAYVTALEDRVEKMEALLKRLRPEADFTVELGPPVVRDSWKSRSLLPFATTVPPPGSAFKSIRHGTFGVGSPSISKPKRSRRQKDTSIPATTSTESLHNADQSSSDSSLSGSDNEDSAVELSLVQGMTHLTLRGLRPAHLPTKHATDGQWRFHGKSSSFKLINTARELKQRHIDAATGADSPDSSSTSTSYVAHAPRRQPYWTSLPWEISFEGLDRSTTTPSFVMAKFPPLDLANSLIDLYFKRNNSLFPLLHRPTFDTQWRDKLYESDLWFACVCMAMFAVASRWCADPRVLPDEVMHHSLEESDDGVWALAGWKYVDVALVAHAESWTLISIGLRKAQDVGAHRRKVYGRKPTVEEELWKRTIWHLIAIDRLGKVDDEYWENEDEQLAFQQPPGKPAVVSAFVCWAKLSRIAAFALRTLYAIGRSKQPLGLVGPRWREDTVAQLNSAMLHWIESLPQHRDKPDISTTALSICASAAKAGTLILEVLLQRGHSRHTVLVHYAFLYAGVMLVSLWTQIAKEAAHWKRSAQEDEDDKPKPHGKQIDELLKVVAMLDSMRPRWELAREACDCVLDAFPTFLLSEEQRPAASHRLNAREENPHEAERQRTHVNVPAPTPRFYYPSSGPSRQPDPLYPVDTPSSHPRSSASNYHTRREQTYAQPSTSWAAQHELSISRADPLFYDEPWFTEPQVPMRRRRAVVPYDTPIASQSYGLPAHYHGPTLPSALDGLGSGKANTSGPQPHIKHEGVDEASLNYYFGTPFSYMPHEDRSAVTALNVQTEEDDLGLHAVNTYRYILIHIFTANTGLEGRLSSPETHVRICEDIRRPRTSKRKIREVSFSTRCHLER
ncbi:hypothetical protein IEO21_01515 [Rhodonia placenta]|uniref:Zn(2)-C6 fungal-type domain-containing protein n=1 Tax=Rhodonia placenta TaxID=104341 RepID=A0A8H7P9V4_9APHY|nr:hypothetical protein IEO21_01515 [Postia placenta]